MKRSTKRILFYAIYITFVFVASTSAILAKSIYGFQEGQKYKIAPDGDVTYIKGDCPCYSYGRDRWGRCKNCGNYVIPEKFPVDWKKRKGVVKKTVEKEIARKRGAK